MPIDTEMSKVRDGARFAGFLPYLAAEVDKMVGTLESRMLDHIRDGSLTPDLAIQGWMELNAYRRLMKRFDQKVKIGQTAGQALAPVLNGEGEDR